MSLNKVGVCVTTYNDESFIKDNIQSILAQETKTQFSLYVVDDGSKDKTPSILKELANSHKNLNIFLTPNNERGIARSIAIKAAMDDNCNYICFVDSDMKFEKNLIEKCMNVLTSGDVSAVIIPEKPFSHYTNFMTKVKIFERELVNDVGEDIQDNSIEGARFWNVKEYLRSGGLNKNQIAFEDTQPTIRIIEKGGVVKRALGTYLYHDEGRVTLKALISKKYYYFTKMPKTFQTEDGGFLKALKRWYFFRPYLYTKKNLIRYIKNPSLFFGLMTMYLSLTVVAFVANQKAKS